MTNSRSIENQITLAIIIFCLPASVTALVLALHAELSWYLISIGLLIQCLVVAGVVYRIRQQLSHRLRSLATVVESALHGDFTMKARPENTHSALADLVNSVNQLSQNLSQEKLASEEKRTLLSKIITQIHVGVITADFKGKIHTINDAARDILNIQTDSKVESLNALQLPLTLTFTSNELINLESDNGVKRIYIQQDQYRDSGLQQRLILLTDVDNLLRQEELKSWENLVRVISHEINNSLAPIASLSDSLIFLLEQEDQSQDTQADKHKDMSEAAHIISERAKSLITFIGQYRNLAGLKEPNKKSTKVSDILQPLMPLFQQTQIEYSLETEVSCQLDENQIKQALINLLKNAEEAMQDASSKNTAPRIVITAREEIIKNTNWLRLEIEDFGSGLSTTKNLFVPFYSTKTQGSGIGLALSRQIVELHGGRLQLKNKPGGSGCIASILLPMN